MKKIVRQQNYLKELIESQDNRFLSIQALRCLIRAVLEPLLDNKEEGAVLHRISRKEGLLSILKRLEFSEVETYDFSDDAGVLREKVWANTEFLCVMTRRFVSIILWDTNTGVNYLVRYYTIFNSKLQNEALDIIGRNTDVDIKRLQEKFNPDRRDNILLNESLRKLIDNLDEASNDAVLGYAQRGGVIKTDEKSQPNSYQNIRSVAHEIKNQLSICDLYSEIIRKYCEKNNITDETFKNATDNIKKAVLLANNNLVSLKSYSGAEIKVCRLIEFIDNICDLTKVYAECKNIEYRKVNKANVSILADENKLSAVLINLIKNASEAFDEEENAVNGKYIKIETETDNNFAVIKVSNNAPAIKEPEKIFERGYTTKSNGTGLGLKICKDFIEEQMGSLELSHTGEDYTEFVIRFGLV